MPSFIAWIAILAMAALIAWAIWRTAAFDRLGRRLAGDHRHDRALRERAASAEGVAHVADLAAELAEPDEVRAIRWTPARATNGARLALGASPAAWYLWLLEPEVLIRIPDALVAAVDHVPQHDAVVRLACHARNADAYITATDGNGVERSDDSFALTTLLLDGLTIVDPEARIADASALGESLGAVGESKHNVAFGIAS